MTDRSPEKRVRWFLVLVGFFVFQYPLAEFVFAVVTGPSKTLPHAFVFAMNMSFTWTLLLWWQHRKGNVKRSVTKPHTRRQARWVIYCVVMFLIIVTIGSLARIFVARPAWWFILVSAAAVPSSTILSNLIFERSNFSRSIVDSEQP